MNNPKNIKKYDKFDLIIIFIHISENTNISRSNLSEYFKIGEGSIKSILQELEKKGLIIKTKQGSVISVKGKKTINKLNKLFEFPQIIYYDIFKDKLNTYALILKEFEKDKKNELYLGRDYAIRCGCWSAMILEKVNNIIKIPLIDSYNFNELNQYISPENNDIIIVASSENIRTTFKGLLSIANHLSDEFNKIVKLFE